MCNSVRAIISMPVIIVDDQDDPSEIEVADEASAEVPTVPP
jgi:hypothetical protein